MAQVTIPKYEYFIVHTLDKLSTVSIAMERFNAEIALMVEVGWQTDGDHQLMYTHSCAEDFLLTQKMKRYSKAYERHCGTSDSRYIVTD